MKKLVEKNALDEDARKDVYKPDPSKNNQIVSFGFKKREVKSNAKKMKAEVSDGETD
jgi:hypothetical protein